MFQLADAPVSGLVYRVLMIALAALALFLALRIVALWIDGIDVSFAPIPVEPVPSVARPLASDWTMLGQAATQDYGFDQPLPPTPLELRLRGVVTGERGYAIIVDGSGNEGVFRVGDEVPGNAEVLSIEARRVVLERAGEREALELPGGSQASASMRANADSAAAEPESRLPAGVGIGGLASLTAQFRLDPAELARRITILPVAGGGFRVRAGRDAALFTQLGFHANDIVTAINGQPVATAADVRAVFENFDPSDPLAISVRRGDRQLVLTPNLVQ